MFGSKEGLFIPRYSESDVAALFVAEGATDVAGLWDMGFSHFVGRPSCTGGVRLLCELVRRRGRPEVVIIGDGDKPGQAGANNLASVLVAYSPAVRVITPPDGIKDVRAWLQTGGTRQDVQHETEQAPVRQLILCGRVAVGQ